MTSRLKALRFTILVSLLALVGLVGTSAASLAQEQSATPATNEKDPGTHPAAGRS